MNTQNFTAYDQQSFMQFTNPSLIHKDLEMLAGILTGIAGDHIVNIQEHEGLLNWVNHIKPYEFKPPYKEVVALLRDAIADNILCEDEIKDIVWFCDRYTTENKYYDDLTAGVQRLHGVVKGIALDHEI